MAKNEKKNPTLVGWEVVRKDRSINPQEVTSKERTDYFASDGYKTAQDHQTKINDAFKNARDAWGKKIDDAVTEAIAKCLASALYEEAYSLMLKHKAGYVSSLLNKHDKDVVLRGVHCLLRNCVRKDDNGEYYVTRENVDTKVPKNDSKGNQKFRWVEVKGTGTFKKKLLWEQVKKEKKVTSFTEATLKSLMRSAIYFKGIADTLRGLYDIEHVVKKD